MTERHGFGALWVRGEDAATFLNGQLTVNVSALRRQCVIGAYCTHQGKVIAIVGVLDWTINDDDGYLLMMPIELLKTVGERLQKYILRSKVSIERLSIGFIYDGVVSEDMGNECLSQHKSYALVADFKTFADKQHADNIVLSGIGNTPLIIVLNPENDHVNQPLKDDNVCSIISQLFIQRGIALIYPPTSEQFVPQMLGLAAIGGIDFDKGCYVGQEVIARMHYKGNVRRHLAWTKAANGLADSLRANRDLYSEQRKAATILAYAEAKDYAVVQAVVHENFIDKPLQLPDDGNNHFIFTSSRTSL